MFRVAKAVVALRFSPVCWGRGKLGFGSRRKRLLGGRFLQRNCLVLSNAIGLVEMVAAGTGKEKWLVYLTLPSPLLKIRTTFGDPSVEASLGIIIEVTVPLIQNFKQTN